MCLLAIVVAAVVNALEGLLQYLGLAGDLYPWVVESLQRGTAYGVFRQPNVFAIFLVIGIVACAWCVRRATLTPAMGWLLCTVLSFGVAASSSRAGLVAVVAVAVGAFVLDRANGGGAARRILIFQPLVYVAAAVALIGLAHLHGFEPAALQERLARTGSDSRLVLWENAIEMMRARPWAGWGWGEFGFAHYELPFARRFGDGSEVVSHAHNLFLHIGAELGVPMAALAMIAAAAFAWRLLRGTGRHPETSYALLILLVIGIHSMVEFPLWWATHLFIASLMAGYALATATAMQPAGATRSMARAPRRAVLAPALCVALIFASLEAGRQYAALARMYLTPSTDLAAKAAAIREAEGAWLFDAQVSFAATLREPVDARNAPQVLDRSLRLLHFSAEPAVVVRVIESAWVLARKDIVEHHVLRFQAAFPERFRYWLQVMRDQRADLAAFIDQLLAQRRHAG